MTCFLSIIIKYEKKVASLQANITSSEKRLAVVEVLVPSRRKLSHSPSRSGSSSSSSCCCCCCNSSSSLASCSTYVSSYSYPIYPSIYLFMYVSIYLSIYLFIYLQVHWVPESSSLLPGKSQIVWGEVSSSSSSSDGRRRRRRRKKGEKRREESVVVVVVVVVVV